MNPRKFNTYQQADISKYARSNYGSGARPSAGHRPSSRPATRSSYSRGAHKRAKTPESVFMPTQKQANQPSALDKELFTIPNSELTVTRRHFLIGVAGVGALAAATVAVNASGILNHDDADFPLLTVPSSAVIASDALAETDISANFGLVGRFELPYGTLVWCNDDSVACCLVPGESAKPLTQIQLLFLGSGNTSTIVDQAVGQSEGFEIYDARATSEGAIWVESDILEGAWRVYTAKFDASGMPKQAVKVDEGNHDWETPTIAMVGSYAYWQVMPNLDGNATASSSALKKAVVGTTSVEVPYISPGRMATPPSATRNGIVITPRTDTTTLHYQLTYLDATNNQVIDSMALPQSMKPQDVGYGKTGFMFCFDGIYDYGDGISNLGSYIPRVAATGEGYSFAPWIRWSRTPLCAPCWCGDYLVVKSTQSVCGIDLDAMTYCATEVITGSSDYGDYLATTGESSRFVTFANIVSKGVNQSEEQYCLVRVYAPL